MNIVLTLLLILASLLVYYIKYLLSYWKRRGIPHDEPSFPQGNMVGFAKTKHITELLTPVYNKYKGNNRPFAGFYFLVKPSVLVLDLELVKNVLIKDFDKFDERGIFFNERDDPLSGNLFQINGEKWRPLRHKISPTFTSGKMKFMFPTVTKIGDEFVNVFSEKVASTNSGVLEITDLLGRFTADVIGTCAFGLECNSLRNPNAEFVVMGRRAFVDRRHNRFVDTFLHSFPKLARNLRMASIHPEIEAFYMRIVKETVEYREKHNIKRQDFMDMLIEMKNSAENPITFEELAAQAFVFFLAGFETSSTTMGFALYELAQAQQVQDKMRAEINQVLKKHNNEFSYECMQELKYVEKVIAETLRKHPVLSQLVRSAKADYTTSEPNYVIEKGTNVIIPVYAIHHDADIYPEPNKFDPERFSEEEQQKRPHCSYLPFGEGPRNCVGLRFGKMQTCIGLTYLIRNFRFSVCEQTKIPFDLVKSNFLLSPQNGIYLKVEKI
ncbi:probable cytochrome P450 6a23 [Teleopsis dalmanni]|uniref:probable cytochrome P450 6a23 n=1 Tax=Teleopsis dalmanni TaxID=139649 RepID=UPI0018CFE7CA|nr:probable cytochrome P450 6a23 [Teleopsis dalmanni]